MEEIIIEQLIQLFEQDQTLQLSYIDEDYGQLEMIDQEHRDSYPITFPALLIDIPATQWSNLAGLSQSGQATLVVKLLIDCYHDTHARSQSKEHIFNRAEKRRRVHEIIMGEAAQQAAPFIRQSSRFYTANHGIKV